MQGNPALSSTICDIFQMAQDEIAEGEPEVESIEMAMCEINDLTGRATS